MPHLVELIPAGVGEKPVVDRLTQLYLHDFSAFAPIDSPHGNVNVDGRFVLAYFDSYWQDAKRRALLTQVNGRWAGFALINDWAPSGMNIDRAFAEFFVMRKYRRTGIGLRVARAIMSAAGGVWEAGVADYNKPAAPFWRRVANGWPDVQALELSGDGKRWSGPILRFECRAAFNPTVLNQRISA